MSAAAMKSTLRCPLVPIAALTIYVAVHILAGGLHHHAGANDRSAVLPTACDAGVQVQSTSHADGHDDEESCPLCSVLHLAQTLPTVLDFEPCGGLNGKAFATWALIRPYPLATATHSRAPPIV
jgi:hypothetical protein